MSLWSCCLAVPHVGMIVCENSVTLAPMALAKLKDFIFWQNGFHWMRLIGLTEPTEWRPSQIQTFFGTFSLQRTILFYAQTARTVFILEPQSQGTSGWPHSVQLSVSLNSKFQIFNNKGAMERPQGLHIEICSQDRNQIQIQIICTKAVV